MQSVIGGEVVKKVIVCALALAVLSGCGAAQTEIPRETVDIEAAKAAAYQEGYDAGYAEAQGEAEGDIARLNEQVADYIVLVQVWEDAFDDVLAEAGLENTEWKLKKISIQAEGGDPTVYIDTNSKYYHKEGCPELNDTPIAVHLSTVRSEGTEPCPVCNPVRYYVYK